MATEKITIQVPVELDDKFFEDIIVTMLEGGSNYWIRRIQIYNPDLMEKPKGLANSTWAAYSLNSKKGTITFYEQDEDYEKGTLMTKEMLVSGLKMWTEKHPGQVSTVNVNGKTTIDAGDIDADDADAILQYTLFGKLVYG